mmetsp:Transcript_50426/g.113332  ORF Transcript_50426/g.113332 Transcript_50426/m.113332 type:complete len:108 (+) Transcript_50426:609-932(+)
MLVPSQPASLSDQAPPASHKAETSRQDAGIGTLMLEALARDEAKGCKLQGSLSSLLNSGRRAQQSPGPQKITAEGEKGSSKRLSAPTPPSSNGPKKALKPLCKKRWD